MAGLHECQHKQIEYLRCPPMSTREYDPEIDAVKPTVKDPVQPPVQPAETLPVLPAVQLQDAPQDAPGREIVPDAKPSPSQESKPSLEPSQAVKPLIRTKEPISEALEHIEKAANDFDTKLEKGNPKLTFINKIVEVSKHWAAMLIYFGCGLVVGWMACMVSGQAIA